ncbi:hypothetical protein PCANB_001604, partial [Pneumocystis canis]
MSTPRLHQLSGAQHRLGQGGGGKEEMEEEHLLALILKEKVQETHCKNKLKEYCQSLKDAELESEKVHEKLKDVCKEKEEEKKCTGLETKIQKKCETLEKGLEALGKTFTEEN